jgi:ABC-type antimicrobial peptide transport system permease subunit
MHQWGGPGATMLIKYEIMPATWADQSVAAIQRADPYQPISRTFTLEGDLERLSSRARFFADVTWFFSVLALAMGGFGTFAVVSAVQASRARETSLRIALGQRSTQAAARVLFAGLRIVLVGLGIGLVISVPVSRLIQDQLFLGGAGAVVSIGAVACALLLVTGIIASVPAAINALSTDASVVLRET